ncbi:type 1 fimbrial protein [Lysobacter sp. MMG2]|uniref:fimbrial protein n=1 Tax=Lysobacter sp. MMG2 TaxID=2801338 RepID=UPI001C2159EF|nr:fimbrial protein [Lysobacter sp. MMG2]MBU8977442.1 type 1 fimbrial protein [Lysobacter sp. MMG2]
MFSSFKGLGFPQTTQGGAAPKRGPRLWPVLLALMLGLPLPSWAVTCTNSNGNQPYPLTFTFPSPLVVDNSMDDGEVVASITITQGAAGGGGYSTCASDTRLWYEGIGAYTLVGRPVYPSSVEGIGIAIFNYSPPGGYFPQMSDRSGASWVVNSSALVRIDLVKTGPITGGSLSGPFAYSTLKFFDGTSFNHTVYQFSGSVPVVLKNPTCAVTTPDVVVNLDQARIGDFATVGTTLKEKDFKVSLACSGGTAGTKTEVDMSLADRTTPANVSQYLSLTSASTASGVALQIVRNGSAISFNPTVNKFKVQDVLPGNSTVDIPFKARYVRTGTITPGKVQGIAVFTMDYK